jgi:hypothetical protein
MHSLAAEAIAGSVNPAIPITAAAITATPNLRTPYSSHNTETLSGVQQTLNDVP